MSELQIACTIALGESVTLLIKLNTSFLIRAGQLGTLCIANTPLALQSLQSK